MLLGDEAYDDGLLVLVPDRVARVAVHDGVGGGSITNAQRRGSYQVASIDMNDGQAGGVVSLFHNAGN